MVFGLSRADLKAPDLVIVVVDAVVVAAVAVFEVSGLDLTFDCSDKSMMEP